METSLYIDVFTAIFLAILGIIIVVIVYTIKIVNRYLGNGKIAEQRLKMDQKDIQEIKQRLDRIEKYLE